MGNIKSLSQTGDHSGDNRRRSQHSVSESIKAPTPIKPPPVVVPLVKEHTKRVELPERDIAFLCSQTGKSDVKIN